MEMSYGASGCPGEFIINCINCWNCVPATNLT